jgi:uncharacterized protein involved in response to NO
MAGRVLPMFTNNAVPGAGARRDPRLETAALASLPILFALEAAGLLALAAWAALAAAALHGARLALWAPLRTLGKPILWILHLSYAWIVLHLALRGLAGFDLVLPMLADHGLTLGMMTRTARGHTGRSLSPGLMETGAYVLVMAAAVARVIVPLTLPASYPMAVLASALLWCAAFALFVLAFFPILTRSRVDGMPG